MACLCQAGCFLRFFIFTQLCFTIAKCTIDCIVELYLLASFDILQIISGLIGFFAIKRSKYCIFANLALSNSFFVLWNTLLIMIYSDVTGKEWLLKVLKLTWNVKNSYFYKNGFICTKIPITSEIKAKLLESKLFDELKVLAATPEDLIRCRINWRMLECTYAGILCAISILIIAMCLVQYKQNKRKNQVNQFTFEAMPKEKPSGPMGYYERRISREELSNTPLIRNDLHLSSNSLATSNVRNNSNRSSINRQRPHPRQMRSEEPQQRRNHIKMDPETRMIPMSGAHVPLSRVKCNAVV